VGEGPVYDQLVELARRAQQAINIRFASVDVVEAKGQLLILEINSGVMMEYFARHFPESRTIAKGIYARAVEQMFSTGLQGT
jgi:glutathione synthase/RimK-type ligase-like ATP-grasp enzyme